MTWHQKLQQDTPSKKILQIRQMKITSTIKSSILAKLRKLPSMMIATSIELEDQQIVLTPKDLFLFKDVLNLKKEVKMSLRWQSAPLLLKMQDKISQFSPMTIATFTKTSPQSQSTSCLFLQQNYSWLLWWVLPFRLSLSLWCAASLPFLSFSSFILSVFDLSSQPSPTSDSSLSSSCSVSWTLVSLFTSTSLRSWSMSAGWSIQYL